MAPCELVIRAPLAWEQQSITHSARLRTRWFPLDEQSSMLSQLCRHVNHWTRLACQIFHSKHHFSCICIH